nr:sugar isomerase domain-containing protein [Saprospiraceae bacterium]
MLAKQWLTNALEIMSRIEETQMEQIHQAAVIMADSIEAGRWVHTFGCGHATIPVEEMYPRIGGFVGFHPMVELPLTFFTRITGEMGVHQFVFLERVEGYGVEIMKGYTFDPRDTMWIFSHSGINNVNIDIALEAKKKGMKVIAYGSAAAAKGKVSRHSSGKTIFDIADLVVDTCAPAGDASVPLKNHIDK